MFLRNTWLGVSNMDDMPIRALAGYGDLLASQRRLEMPPKKGICGQHFFLCVRPSVFFNPCLGTPLRNNFFNLGFRTLFL